MHTVTGVSNQVVTRGVSWSFTVSVSGTEPLILSVLSSSLIPIGSFSINNGAGQAGNRVVSVAASSLVGSSTVVLSLAAGFGSPQNSSEFTIAINGMSM